MTIIGVGTEIVACARIQRMIERHGGGFLRRAFTPAEIAYCEARHASAEHFAGRWAAKQAVLKALGGQWSASLKYTDMEVRAESAGPVKIALGGGARETCEQRRVAEIHLSISHAASHVVAFAIATSAAVKQ